jgi:PPM family protein phosphatase
MEDKHPSPLDPLDSGLEEAGTEEAVPGTAPDSDTPPPASPRGDFLEELTLPSLIQPPDMLQPDTVLGPEGRLRILEHLGARGRINLYAGTWRGEDGHETQVEIREGPADHPGLRRESEILSSVRYAMLPTLGAAFEQDERLYLALDIPDGESLDEALRSGMDAGEALSVILQLVQAVRRLHRSGWALIGMSPADVHLGQPIRLVGLGHAVRIGEAMPQSLQVAGYSAPEMAHQAAVTGKEDVYTLGAILYHALTGSPLPDVGDEEADVMSTVFVPGGPQLLAGALAPAEDRMDLEQFYRALLALRQRLAEVAMELEIASATTIGLNPTRLVNEDSCGYVAWSSMTAERATFRALLCVADGMGGMDAGEIASQAALASVLEAAGSTSSSPAVQVEGSDPVPGPRSLDPVDLIRRAAPAVHAAAGGRQTGTTITCIAVQDALLTLGHVGDTRAYHLRGDLLTRLTADHSLVAAMVASGVLSPEEAEGHPDSNKVLRSLGSQRELPDGYVDGLEAATGQPTLSLQPGDTLLLCSDGVWGEVDDAEMQAILASSADCSTAARVLVDRALRAGAPDNATAIVARCRHRPTG